MMEEEIKKAVEALKQGKVILYPTDTIWGIGCDATNAKAVDKVYKIKHRVETKSMIVLLDDADKLSTYMEKVPDIAWDLLNSIQTPLTIIFPKAKNIAKRIIAADHTIAIRITRDEFCKKVIAAFGKPIVSSSANISGQNAPIMFSMISDEVKKEVDFIVNLEKKGMREAKPSTIIKLQINGEFEVIRR
jgi:L-threonylcarbamoyladenylate synthase